jgi:3-dehydroquinate dehydratase type I
MPALPFYIVTLSHPTWEDALACARALPENAWPEVRLDLFPDEEPGALVDALRRRCLVACRRESDGGRWPDADEGGRLEQLRKAVEARPAWVDLEWELPIPEWLESHRMHTRILRSVHVAEGVFDLPERLGNLPDGDAFKWVGRATRLADNARLKAPLAEAADRNLPLSAFLMGPKGIPSRCLQAAWGGRFTYAAPDDGPAAAPGQLPLAALRSWRCAKLHRDFGLCGVIGTPVQHSRGPGWHNAAFQRQFKDLLYLPLECGDAEEAAEALEALPILGLSITAPLKLSLPARLGLAGPLNTLWRRAPGEPWAGANTDSEALAEALLTLPSGPVLVLGDGGVATTTLAVLAAANRPSLRTSRRAPASAEAIRSFAPVGIIQATSLGLDPADPCPLPEALEAARPSLRWALEWIYKEDTAFAAWARELGLVLVDGSRLFEGQAVGQSRRFIEGCGL